MFLAVYQMFQTVNRLSLYCKRELMHKLHFLADKYSELGNHFHGITAYQSAWLISPYLLWVISPSSCWWCPNSGYLFSVRSNIASFPGIPQRGGEGEGPRLKECIWRTCSLFWTRSSTFVALRMFHVNSSTWGRNCMIRPQARSFNEGLPIMVDTDVIDMIKWTRPSPSVLHTASDQKLDSGKAWEQA